MRKPFWVCLAVRVVYVALLQLRADNNNVNPSEAEVGTLYDCPQAKVSLAVAFQLIFVDNIRISTMLLAQRSFVFNIPFTLLVINCPSTAAPVSAPLTSPNFTILTSPRRFKNAGHHRCSSSVFCGNGPYVIQSLPPYKITPSPARSLSIKSSAVPEIAAASPLGTLQKIILRVRPCASSHAHKDRAPSISMHGRCTCIIISHHSSFITV